MRHLNSDLTAAEIQTPWRRASINSMDYPRHRIERMYLRTPTCTSIHSSLHAKVVTESIRHASDLNLIRPRGLAPSGISLSLAISSTPLRHPSYLSYPPSIVVPFPYRVRVSHRLHSCHHYDGSLRAAAFGISSSQLTCQNLRVGEHRTDTYSSAAIVRIERITPPSKPRGRILAFHGTPSKISRPRQADHQRNACVGVQPRTIRGSCLFHTLGPNRIVGHKPIVPLPWNINPIIIRLIGTFPSAAISQFFQMLLLVQSISSSQN